MALTPRSAFQRLALVALGGLLLVFGTAQLGQASSLFATDAASEREQIRETVQRIAHEKTPVHAASSTDRASTVFLQESFSVRDGDMLDLNLGSDDIVVETVRGTTAEVIIEGTGRDAREVFERREYQVFYESGRLNVRTPPNRQRGNWQRNTRASFTVTVRIPERFDASIDVGSGDVRLDRLTGDLNVDTGSGEIYLGTVSGGDIRIDTGSGDVEADRLDGSRIVIDTGSGEVSVGELVGRARIDTGSGDVTVGMDAGHNLVVDTGSGEVTITLPRSADAELAIRGGDVDIDRDFDFDGRSDDDSARGTLGKGGPRIAVSTGSGDIQLRAR